MHGWEEESSFSQDRNMERFIFGLILLTFRARTSLTLPSFKGATFSSGHAFRKMICGQRASQCDQCFLKERSVYAYVFETVPPPDTVHMRKYDRAPHPFVIEALSDRNTNYAAG